jgi:hypothetical protein
MLTGLDSGDYLNTMDALALIDEPLEPREVWADEDALPLRRPAARRARLRLVADGRDVDVEAVADAIVRRLAFTAALRADLVSES